MVRRFLKGIKLLSAVDRVAVGDLVIQPSRSGTWLLKLRTFDHPAGLGEPLLAGPAEVVAIGGASTRMNSSSGTYALCRLGRMLAVRYASFDGGTQFSGMCVADDVDRAVADAIGLAS